ncbi:ImmA/IrrE family metallo-endopeptidase [Flavobacterium mekongense]|uniref:ImmA/IrrE family metallo-endopeptidase n=1 Tax=Flavobacterium mekongense TaxID=3379707 RepID=UPI00399B3166
MIKNSSDLLIKKIAESLAMEYSENITPLEKILDDEEIELFYDSYGNSFDGMTIYDNDRFYIHINTYRGNRPDTNRARFTIGHELGHFFIDNHRIGLKNGLLSPHFSINNVNETSKIEREADFFASNLLMPEVKFKKAIGREKFTFQLIKRLSQEFNTSITATAIRLSDIGNHPLMLVYCENAKIIWKWNSDDFKYKYLLHGKAKIPEDTVVGEYFYKNKCYESTEDVWAIDWFEYVRKEDYGKKIKEHCIVHKEKALSIIWE